MAEEGATPDIWLLPGLDGTGRLYARLERALAEVDGMSGEHRVFAYDDRATDYDTLLSALPCPTRPTILVGESFGGPLALRLAARDSEYVTRVVLVASFVRPPRPLLGPLSALVARSPTPPAIAVQAAMLGRGADQALVREVHEAIASTPATTLAGRLATLATVDATNEARSLMSPITAIVATRDALVPEQRASEAAKLARKGTVVRVEGPHLLAQRCAPQVAAILGAQSIA